MYIIYAHTYVYVYTYTCTYVYVYIYGYLYIDTRPGGQPAGGGGRPDTVFLMFCRR